MKPPYRRVNDTTQYPSAPGSRKSRNRALPVVAFGAIALLVAIQETPWVRDRVNGLVRPAAQRAIEDCRIEAMTRSDSPELVRLIRGGSTEKTQNGLIVEKLVIGEPNRELGEQSVRITCHFDSTGQLVNFAREVLPKATDIAPAASRDPGPPSKNK